MKKMLLQVIEYWRNRHSELDHSEAQKVYKPFHLASPIQIEIFRLYNAVFNQSVSRGGQNQPLGGGSKAATGR